VSFNPPQALLAARQSLRQRLLAEREVFVASPSGAATSDALAKHLRTLLSELAPDCLGVYWPVRSEFNAASLGVDNDPTQPWSLALPFAHRHPREMHYREWDGTEPGHQDECGIRCSIGPPVIPDVILVPCVGFTDEGFRLGYGGGYFDRYLAQHPQVTTVGVAWSVGRLSAEEFQPEGHDQPLMVVVTDEGVVGG
jgi:5-formyltetrahydrofolate cyclo-ligase